MKASKLIAIAGGALIGICGYVWCQATAGAAHLEGRQEMGEDIVNTLKEYTSKLESEEKTDTTEVEG